MGSTRRFITVALSGAVLLSGCLPDGNDPSAGTHAGKTNAAYYASTLSNIATRIQNSVVRDASWFDSGDSSEFNFAKHGLSQPTTLGADLRSLVCFSGTDNDVKQLTWIDGKNDDGRFVVRVLGTRSGQIESELRKQLGPEQVGSYGGGGTIDMADGTTLTIPTGCQSVELPIGAPVVVFDIQHPAPPSQEVSRTEYRTTPCQADASGRARRGTMVQSRILTFKPDGSVFPPDTNTGWSTESLGTCVDDIDVKITDRDVRPTGAAATLGNFALGSIRNTLLAQLSEMDCAKVSVRRDSGGVSKTKTIDTCRNASINGNQAFADDHTGNDSDTREVSCKGSVDATVALFSNAPPVKSTISWESRAGFTQKATLKRVSEAHETNTSTGQSTKHDRWVADGISCAGTEIATIPCASIPGAPVGEPRSANTPYSIQERQNFDSATGEGGEAAAAGGQMTSFDVLRLNPDYFSGVETLRDNAVTIRREVTATSWEDAAAFKPKLAPGDMHIESNQCEWKKLEMGDCPTEVDPAQQGTWYPTSTAIFSPTYTQSSAMDSENFDYLMNADATAPAPDADPEAFRNTMNNRRPRTIDTPVTDAEIEADRPGSGQSGNGHVFRWLQQQGKMPLGVRSTFWSVWGWTSWWPVADGQLYLKRWSTTLPNNVVYRSDETYEWTGTQIERRRDADLRRTEETPVDVQTTLLNTQGVELTYKPGIANGQLAILGGRYSKPLYCGRSEDRLIAVPFNHYDGCSGSLIEERTVEVAFSAYRRWRGTAPGIGSWSKPIFRFTTADENPFVRIAGSSMFDKPLEAGSEYVTANGEPILPKKGLRYSDACEQAPEQPSGGGCPAVVDPVCPAGQTLIPNPASGSACPLPKICATQCMSPSEYNARTPVCPPGQVHTNTEYDGRGCPVLPRCVVPDTGYAHDNWERLARERYDNCVASTMEWRSCCSMWPGPGACPFQ